jgi:hypothetical protein
MVGQHIRILRGGRWIHAVDCGDETVLHLAEEAPPPRVRRAYRPEFVAGAVAVEVVTHRERTFAAKEIVKRAYSRASDPALASMFPDSEAFVEWCTTGRETGARNVALVGAGGLVGGAPVVVAKAEKAKVVKRAAAKPVKKKAAAKGKGGKAKVAKKAAGKAVKKMAAAKKKAAPKGKIAKKKGR